AGHWAGASGARPAGWGGPRPQPGPRRGPAAVRPHRRAGQDYCPTALPPCGVTAMLCDKEGRGPRGRPAAAAVLADRLAAALVHHEPGWRLPRLTALARRYSVSSAEIDAAIEELAARHLVRRLPDGQVYRASPAEYWVPLEGVFGLVSRVDPMGGHLACTSRHATVRRPPED